jgi:FkbH-like protein
MDPTDDRHAARAAVSRWRQIVRSDPDPSVAAGRSLLIAPSFTANPIEPGLGVALAELEVGRNPPTITFADYNQIFQVCLQPEASGAAAADDVVVLWRIEDVFERDFHDWGNGEERAGDRLFDGARSLAESIAQLAANHAGSVIVSDAPVPIGFGLDHDDPAQLTELVDLQHAINRAFDEVIADAPVERFRLAALQHAAGTLASFDRRNWVMYRQPYPDWFAHRVGAGIADLIAARTRVPPKVIVLDCDNTIWGGTFVDDGIGGLQCSDAFPGFSYRSFQFAAQRLRHRGVLLAIASKNDPESVVDAFAQVDGMVLNDDDIAGRRVSWLPKPQGIAELADEFNLGLDSFVFVDDSDYELGAVNTLLPDVRTLRVPDDIEQLPDLLAESGWFRLMRVTDDDRERTTRMIAESGRTSAATTMTHEEFLASLDLKVHRIEVGPNELGRVTQLINKTNQFNLTTIRRSESEVAAFLESDESCVLAFSVDDQFGEYGVVGVTIARHSGKVWDLDTVLMSCRVLGRGVETAMLAATVDTIRSRRPGAVAGHFLLTDRNAMVASLLPDHGFDPVTHGDEAAEFVLPADRSIAVPDHITVVDS